MRNKNSKLQLGFTIMELMVVVTIMALISTIGIINWNKERSARTMNIARGETTTNIRKIQSYAVSSRTAPAGPAKYYIMQFDQNSSNYKVYAATGSDNGILSTPVETLALPTGVTVSAISLEATGTGPSGQEVTAPKCIFIIFSATYGRTYFTSTNDQCVLGWLQNTLNNFPELSTKANYKMTLTYTFRGASKYIKVYGLTGRVLASDLLNGD